METLDKIHAYWKNPDTSNAPQRYISGVERTRFLMQLVTPYVKYHHKILELGCNIGRNLNALWRLGYHNLSGIEINADALKLGREIFKPEFFAVCTFYRGSVEEVLPMISKQELIFTMAFLEHLHPDSEWVFEEISKKCKYLVTVEDEGFISWRHFPRNYQKVFQKLGMEQLYWENCLGTPGLTKDFQARIFRRKK